MERLSTGLRNWLLGYGSMREVFADCVLKIYSGTAPASADDAVTGVLLATITKASGTVDTDKYNATALSERSTCKHIGLTLDGDHASGDTVIINVNYNGAGAVSHTYTNTDDAGDNFAVRDMVVRWLNKNFGYLMAVGGDTDDNLIWVRARIPGDTLVIADNGGTITVTVDDGVAAARSNCIYFAAPSAGAMSKATETWSGVIATTGVAGYFRIVEPEDDGTLSTTQRRAQGTVATSGAELNLSTTSLVAGTTLTIDSYSISLPAE
jgi:hypothetical protein